MKILHVASFSGNIGDNASHAGFKTILDKFLPHYTVTPLEIRKFYKNYQRSDKLRFDDSFLRLLKNYDLLVIGGGGFFDYWVPGSETGTTIDIAPAVLEAIDIPVIISSVGCMPHKDVPPGNIKKFRRFLDILLAKEKTYVAVRNDGSTQTLRHFIGPEYAGAIPEIVDHGFFYQNDGHYFRPFEGRYIAINSTSDQLNMKNVKVGPVNHELYHRELRTVINHVIDNTDLHLAFVPHIYSDVEAIYKILSGIDDFLLRTRVAIAPYSSGTLACDQAFSTYRNSELNIGMRFHANVCSIAMHKPTIGLAALDRVVNVFENMGIGSAAIPVDAEFSGDVVDSIDRALSPETASSFLNIPLLEEKKAATISYYESLFGKL